MLGYLISAFDFEEKMDPKLNVTLIHCVKPAPQASIDRTLILSTPLLLLKKLQILNVASWKHTNV